jgi:hypothetical protein
LERVAVDAPALFLERCTQVADLTQSSREIDLLDMAGIIRQLLLDGTPLVHKINSTYHVKLVFRVGDFSIQPDRFTAVLELGDGLDPDTSRPGKPVRERNLDGFLGHKLIYMRGGQVSHSVRDVIKFAAEVAGGIHHTQNPERANKLLADFGAIFQVGGLPGGIRQLQAIGRVTLKGLAPLVDAVKAGRDRS